MVIVGVALVTASLVHAADRKVVTQGRANTTVASIFQCPGGSLVRPTGYGEIVAADGSHFTMPSSNEYQNGPRATDLYNECAKVTPADVSQVKVDQVPIVTIDPDGEVITGYLIADNYFELYVNGKLVGVDPIPFTPFNSAIVRFRAKKPITYAVKLIDWEENLGLGTEKGRTPFHPGDGGFVARFSDGTKTDSSWKAQSFYIAPLKSPDDVVEKGNVHETPALPRTYPEAPDNADCGENCYAVHYAQPKDWHSKNFDDKNWPAAFEFTHEQMGTQRLKAFTNFKESFGDAKVIWSNNLVFDNVVLVRKVQK
jgi:hypothetical protein